jgi:putative membrane protein
VGVLLALAVVALGASVVIAPVPAPAAPQQGPALENDELVLATLDPSGLPEDAVLVSTVTARGGERREVTDPASTTNVDYLDRRGRPSTTDGAVIVEVGGSGVTSAVTQATFDRPLPVALHAEYAMDGIVVSPEQVLGRSGELTVRYTVTNTTAQQTTLRYEDASGAQATRDLPVFVPFAGTLTVLLPRGSDLLDAGTGIQSTDAQGRTVLTYRLLLAPPMGAFQQEALVRLATDAAETPGVVLAVEPTPSADDPPAAFGAQSLAGSVAASTELASAVGALGDQTGSAVAGAEQLAAGTDALASGADLLAGSIGGPLQSGSEALDAGAGRLAEGAQALATGLSAAAPGADSLAGGAAELATGLGTLAAGLDRLAAPDGLPAAVGASDQLAAGATQVADALGSAADGPWPPPGSLPQMPDLSGLTLDDLLALTPEDLQTLRDDLADLGFDSLPADVPPPTVVQSLRLLQTATDALTRLAALLVLADGERSALLADAAAAASSAAHGAEALAAQVCGPAPTLTPQQCEQLDSVAADAAAAHTAVVKAQVVSVVLLAGVAGVDAALALVEQAVAEVSAGVRSGSTAEPGLVEGLGLLSAGLAQSVSGVQALQAGASAAASGAGVLAGGASSLSSGLDEAAAGATALSSGATALSEGTAAQAAGVATLASGASALAAGAADAASGSALLASGLQQLQAEGIEALRAGVVAGSADPALAAAWVQATDERAADALPYGPPEGAVGRAAYRLSMDATSTGGTPAWQWWLLGAGALGAAAYAARRRLTGSAPPNVIT